MVKCRIIVCDGGIWIDDVSLPEMPIRRHARRAGPRCGKAKQESTRMEGVHAWSPILLLAGGVALIGSLVIGPAATAGPERTSAGTVVLIHDQEPPNLQNNWVGNGTLATVFILNNIWYGGEIRDANAALGLAELRIEAKAHQVEPADGSDHLRQERAVEQREADDRCGLKATWQASINPSFNVNDRPGTAQSSPSRPRVRARSSSTRRRTRTGRTTSRPVSTRPTSSTART